jgi:hypothetical protein
LCLFVVNGTCLSPRFTIKTLGKKP